MWKVSMLFSLFPYLHELALGNWQECKSILANWQHANFAYRAQTSSVSKHLCTLSFSHAHSRKDLLLWPFLLQVESLDIQKTEGILSENHSNLHTILLRSCLLRPHLCWRAQRLLLVQLDTKKNPKKGGRGEGKKDKEKRGEVVRNRRKTNNPCQLHWRNCVNFLLLVWQTSSMLTTNQAQLYGPSNSEFKFRFSQLWKSLVQCHANLKACMVSRKWPSNIPSQCANKRLEIKIVPIKKNSKTYRLVWSWKRAKSQGPRLPQRW